MFKVGDRLLSVYSGKPWRVLEIMELDTVGTIGYRVRRLRGNSEFGPTHIHGDSTFYLSDYQDINVPNMAAKQAFIGKVFMGTD